LNSQLNAPQHHWAEQEQHETSTLNDGEKYCHNKMVRIRWKILLDSWSPFSPNQRSCSPSPLASSTSSVVVLVSSCPSLQTPTLFTERAHHPSSTHAVLSHSISLCHLNHCFPSILTSPSGPLFSFSPSVLHHTLLSPLLSQSFLKLPSHFPSNTMSHSVITSLILHNSNKPFLSTSARTFLSSATDPCIPWTSPSQFLLLLSQLPHTHRLHSPYAPDNRNLSPFPPLHTTPPLNQ